MNNALISAATPNKVTNAGTGSPNRLLYIGTGGTTPPPPAPTTCSGLPEQESGSLSSGGVSYHPGANDYYYSAAGTHVGCISGPSTADFDLYLERWNGSTWVVVAQATGSTSEERITYNGTTGYYSWRVQSYSGSGSYRFGLDRP